MYNQGEREFHQFYILFLNYFLGNYIGTTINYLIFFWKISFSFISL